jgi:alpha-D-xyloside xylohydrolase
MWLMGNESMNTQIDFVNLRYRLLPYIYSNAGAVTHQNSTIMRSLVMDFPKDTKALDTKFQYMFGKALMVCPVVKPGIKSQKCYLPKNTDWYDFWTGEKFKGGQIIERAVELQMIPLFVRAGSIVPFGPFLQYATQKPADQLEIRIYTGENGSFTLYEDEGENYNYEKGHYSTIELKWNESDKSLIICNLKGRFAGLLNERIFNIVLVGSGKACGIAEVKNFDKQVKYNGEEVKIKF